MNGSAAEHINILGRFCGKRDVESLDCESLYKKYEIERADVMVLFGGSKEEYRKQNIRLQTRVLGDIMYV